MSLIEAKAAAENIFDETMTPVQIAALLTSLKMRGESIDEICAFAQVLREKSIRIAPRVDALVDTCGTGGDSSNTFNISTAAAIIASSAGAAVAKHGNRSVSSKSGSADVFEKLGAKLLQPQEVKQCIEKTSFGFMFAPYFNPIMKQVAGVRKELGFRTIFNIVGPLTNPASANFQLLGVFDPGMVEKTAECLLKLDSKHAMVVHSEGLDEIGLGTTNIAEVKNGIVESYEIDASDFGFRKKEIPLVQTSEESAKIINRVLVGAEDSAARDICLLNAAAALYISGKATGLEEGISKAANAIDSGKAKAKLEDIIEFGARY
jgi:anthranilate phosphoribosyltransferase